MQGARVGLAQARPFPSTSHIVFYHISGIQGRLPVSLIRVVKCLKVCISICQKQILFYGLPKCVLTYLYDCYGNNLKPNPSENLISFQIAILLECFGLQ
ncbi:MAG: hypothetical protein N2201_01365 [candidate division WOR-3 bacterium]|nr:hypothetical protein [candidate division WOR-3 bacterium]